MKSSTDTQKGVLLLNLGTPDSTSVPDVRRYLREFLTDGRVINLPAIPRWLLVHWIITPTRSPNSAEAYANIWTSEGSPLLVSGRQLQTDLKKQLDMPVALGMRYGNPSTAQGLRELLDQGAKNLYVIPLYPHYAMSSYETAVVKAREEAERLDTDLHLTFMPPFYQDRGYLEALKAAAEPYLKEDHDLLLLSYHGIPEEHLQITDPTCSHCLRTPDCCNQPSVAHATCYRHQCLRTSELFREIMDIPPERIQTSFQSRLGRKPWLQPYTDQTLEALPEQGVKKLLVMCPAFVADNLETLEEIAQEGKETFLEAGGESLKLIPCLNNHPRWTEYLAEQVNRWQQTRSIPDQEAQPGAPLALHSS